MEEDSCLESESGGLMCSVSSQLMSMPLVIAVFFLLVFAISSDVIYLCMELIQCSADL